MLQWIRSLNIHPFHLTLPVLALYYWMYKGHWLASIFLLAFFILFRRRYDGKRFLCLLGFLSLFALCFAFRIEQGKQELVLNMLRTGISIEEIASMTNLPVDLIGAWGK